MLKNYFTIAWRNLLKNKVYSFINILGLALGMAVAILIGLWIWDEISFDHNFKNHDRIGQIMVTQTFDGHTGTQPAMPIPAGQELKNKYGSDFKYVTLTSWNNGFTYAVGDKKVSDHGMWVQPDFPKMLTLKMVKGDINALNDLSSALVSASLIKSLFGDADPMGKTIRVSNKWDMKVAGVYQDMPQNSTFATTKILLPWDKYVTTENWLKNAMINWGDHSFQIFVQLQDHADFAKVTDKIKAIVRPHFKEGNEWVLVHPMNKWHLESNFVDGKLDGGRIQYVWMFGIIGVFVLLLACINFMNLSTARSEKRAKEVGIRKAIGSVRQQLIYQFLSESVLMALIAFALSIVLVLLFLPYFNSLSSKEMSLPWANPLFWLMALVFTVFTGVLSGSYPAFYLSGFNTVKVLKGTFKVGRFAALPRKVLVVIQFTVSVAIIIGTIIVYKQIQFAKNRPVGYTREGLITVDMTTPDLYGHYEAIKNDLIKTGAVENVAESSSPSTGVWSNQIGYEWEGKDPTTNPVFGTIAVTHDFGKTIGWHINNGRDFSRAFKTDSLGMVINQTAAKVIGFKNPVGKTIKFDGKNYTIIGVIDDMIMDSPYTPAIGTIFRLDYNWVNVITLRINPHMPVKDALAKIEPVFKKYNPNSPFDFKFTDTEYGQKFADEIRIGNLATFFAILAIFISSLGLFGLASFVAEQRTKEIGVRKVLGASVYNVWTMLSKDFLALVIISCIIAIPLAWYYLSGWLKGYVYHTEISWWVFILASVGAVAITILTVSFQAIKAALANPIKSLRTE
ncbi:ABC transporter permease [Mucilaginibacter sp. KACC 22063]|uniref:ABC transporter permease n=1 Tax=Mucilaginibacter sp. KACC 22063 TaxID=3025666 RepID=UPI002367037C|nr:ABC transporter permease [Mucilaginibacter sp. KACC 22063]WDF54831.1 ABC transporter permease [Mucilaginibacter sp. KACC 22063]